MVLLQICGASCAAVGWEEAAVEDGTVCLCGTGDQLAGLAAATCPATCPADGAECGGPDGQVTGEPVPPRVGPVQLPPLPGPVTATGAGAQVVGSTNTEDTRFLVSPGDGSPPFVLSESENPLRAMCNRAVVIYHLFY